MHRSVLLGLGKIRSVPSDVHARTLESRERSSGRRPLGLACLVILSTLLISTTAQAQFVYDSTTPGGADGATAAAAGDVAYGTGASAAGEGTTGSAVIVAKEAGKSAFTLKCLTLAVRRLTASKY